MTVKVRWREKDHPRDDIGRFTDKAKRPTIRVRFKGGEGSGNFGHAGRPGLVGGSAAGSGGVSVIIKNKLLGIAGSSGIKKELANRATSIIDNFVARAQTNIWKS